MFRTLLAILLLIAPSAALAQTRVAILYFDNNGNPDLEPLKVGLAQMLITDLLDTKNVDLVERSRIQEIMDELELGHSGVVDPSTAAEIGKLLQADWMVMGGYAGLFGTLRIDARAVHVETGKVLFAEQVNGKTETVFSMEKALAEQLRKQFVSNANSMRGGSIDGGSFAPDPRTPLKLDVGDDKTEEAQDGKPKRGHPDAFVDTTPVDKGEQMVAKPDGNELDAAVAFSEGLIALDRKDVTRAREAFEQALATAPQLEEARAQLAALEL